LMQSIVCATAMSFKMSCNPENESFTVRFYRNR